MSAPGASVAPLGDVLRDQFDTIQGECARNIKDRLCEALLKNIKEVPPRTNASIVLGPCSGKFRANITKLLAAENIRATFSTPCRCTADYGCTCVGTDESSWTVAAIL